MLNVTAMSDHTLPPMAVCPFCKSANVCPDKIDVDGQWFVECGACGARGPERKTVAQAIGSWNDRTGGKS
jgi:Lar family restriction alleviation protein